MMAWSSIIPESPFPWSDGELENWRTEYLKQPETLFISPSPDPSTTTRTLTARPPSYNYELQLPSNQLPSAQFPSMPVALGTMLSPTPSPSYLDPSNIKRSISNHSPRSVPTQATATVLSPASLYDARCPSPWDDLPVSTPIIKETLQSESDEARKESSQTKMPCLSRRRTTKRKCVFSSLLKAIMVIRMLNVRHLGTPRIMGLSNANGRAVNMTVCSRAKECSSGISRLSISILGLLSVPGVSMLRVDGRT
jgi:hypothetical protein